jgi:aminodeoxyfutalosine synthase
LLASKGYEDIEEKIVRGARLSREDGVRLFRCHDLAWLGAMADLVRRRRNGDLVYYNLKLRR